MTLVNPFLDFQMSQGWTTDQFGGGVLVERGMSIVAAYDPDTRWGGALESAIPTEETETP